MQYRTYYNFDIRVSGSMEPGYEVEVTGSPAGETPQRLSFELAEGKALATSFMRNLHLRSPAESMVHRAGAAMWEMLFPGPVRSLFRASIAGLAPEEGLRVRLRIDVPAAAGLPWEYCYDAERASFLALDTRTPLVRYVALPDEPRPLAVGGALKIVVVAAAPDGLPPVDAARELAGIQLSLATLVRDGRVAVDVVNGHSTVTTLQKCLRAEAHVLHYIGHGFVNDGNGRGTLALENATGGVDLLDSEAAAVLLRSSAVRLVTLNACETAVSPGDAFLGLAQALVRAGIPAVVAHQSVIADTSASEFASAFYAALADSWPVDAAVTEGRKAVRLRDGEQRFDWGVPALFMRTPDGMLLGGDEPNPRSAALDAPPVTAGGNVVVVGGAGHSIRGDIFGGDKIDIRDSTFGRDAAVPSVSLARQLAAVRKRLDQLSAAGQADEETTILALAQLDLALIQVRKPSWDRERVGKRLHKARQLLESDGQTDLVVRLDRVLDQIV